MARARGAPARSVFKIEEIDRRWRLLRPGQRVLELGAAPGSWAQYAAGRIGSRGYLCAVDLQPLAVTLPAWAEVRQGDVYALGAAPGWPADARFDVVLSDMAPATMGHHGTDAARSASLVICALDLADAWLAPDGHVVVKILEGGELPAILARLRRGFRKVELLRPRATRRASTEIFLVGLNRHA